VPALAADAKTDAPPLNAICSPRNVWGFKVGDGKQYVRQANYYFTHHRHQESQQRCGSVKATPGGSAPRKSSEKTRVVHRDLPRTRVHQRTAIRCAQTQPIYSVWAFKWTGGESGSRTRRIPGRPSIRSRPVREESKRRARLVGDKPNWPTRPVPRRKDMSMAARFTRRGLSNTPAPARSQWWVDL